MDPDEYKYYFFDLDKTIWNWDSTVIGAEDTIDTLRDAGKKVYFHTDNSLLSRKGYARKLTGLGIPAEEDDVITSSYVAARYLARNDVTKVYAMGSQGLIEELENQDIELSKDAETVLAGFDKQFSYEKLSRAADILGEGGELLVCSSERTFRTSNQLKPHQGPFNQALKEFGEPKMMGKPGETFRKELKKYFSYFSNASVFIGDRFADIETGNRLGMTTAAVMSGEVTREQLKNADEMREPDYGLSSLTRLKSRVI